MVRSAAIAALACAVGTGCAGNLDTDFLKADDPSGQGGAGGGAGGAAGGTAVAHCDDAPAIMKAKCGSAGCHEPNSSDGADLDLLTGDVAARLLGVASTGTEGSACGADAIYLVPNSNPARGLFVDKLTYPSCGRLMPPIGSFPAASVQCLLDWATSLTAAAP
jgi:hypothetical protein